MEMSSSTLIRVGTGAGHGGTGIPPRTSGGSSNNSTSALSCNLCSKALTTTCFLCSCDCIFCEECTYSHFENSCECPTCRRRLGEKDFTELVVADVNNGMSDIGKASMQALFSKKSNCGYLPYSDLCQSLIHQIDCSKQSTKFLLKQLLVECHKESRKGTMASRSYEALKAQNTQLKQLNSSQRLQYEQTINELQNKLKAREGTISELNKMLDQFRKYHDSHSSNNSTSNNAIVVPHAIPNSSSEDHHRRQCGRQEPPLRGLMAQREANHQAQKNAMNGRRHPFFNGLNASNSFGSRGQINGTNSSHRPFSSSSTGSTSSTPRIRDLTANSGYHFTGISNQALNKRRRGGGTPSSISNVSSHHRMSPATAFTLNQGPHGRSSIFNGQG